MVFLFATHNKNWNLTGFNIGWDSVRTEDDVDTEKLGSKCTRKQLLQLVSVAEDTYQRALQNANNALLITKFCADLRQAIGR